MHATRRPAALFAIAAITVPITFIAACGGSATPRTQATESSEKSEKTAASGNADANRETAERRLKSIDTNLGTVLTQYRGGKTQQAYKLAKSTTDLYEGTTEGVTTRMCAADNRQLDPLLMATLPNAVHNNQSAGEVARLVQQGQKLARHCLNTIHEEE